MTNKDYCDYDTCVALKELGYVGSSRYYYTQQDRKFHYDAYNKFYTVRTANAMGYVLAIHLYDAQKWLREEKGIVVDVSFSPFGYFASMYTNVRNVEGEILKERFKFEWSEKWYGEEEHDSYEGALLEGINGVVKILKNGLDS